MTMVRSSRGGGERDVALTFSVLMGLILVALSTRDPDDSTFFLAWVIVLAYAIS